MALSPDDVLYLDQSRRRVRDTYRIGTEQNDYQRAVAQENYKQQYANMLRQYQQQGDRLPWGFAARGMGDSGIYGRALKDYWTDRTRSLGQLDSQLALANRGFNLNQSQLDYIKAQSNMDLDLQEQRRRSVADSIRAAMY